MLVPGGIQASAPGTRINPGIESRNRKRFGFPVVSWTTQWGAERVCPVRVKRDNVNPGPYRVSLSKFEILSGVVPAGAVVVIL